MPATTSPLLRSAVYAGDRELRRTCARFGEELRELRLRAGVSQAAVARAIGVARSVVCRLEAGDVGVSARTRARAAAVVGSTFRMAAYPDAEPLIRDAAHARLVEALLAIKHPSWQATLEAPVPGPGHRASDIRLDAGPQVVLIEVESRIRVLETIVRELQSKRQVVLELERSSRPVSVLLALPATRHHRALVRAHPALVSAALPVGDAAIRAALNRGHLPWPGDGLLWLPVRPIHERR
ncbi:MAG TPA: helix-turn-helix transcriptional regulator [Candidatus Limnocylindrales bacterium]